jgi:hypothetical protein
MLSLSWQWKFIATGGGNGSPGPQLYDLAVDLAEERNLADSRMDKLNEMRVLLSKIRGDAK